MNVCCKINAHVKYLHISCCYCFLTLITFFSSVKYEENASVSSLSSGTTAHSSYQKGRLDTEATQSGTEKQMDLGS